VLLFLIRELKDALLMGKFLPAAVSLNLYIISVLVITLANRIHACLLYAITITLWYPRVYLLPRRKVYILLIILKLFLFNYWVQQVTNLTLLKEIWLILWCYLGVLLIFNSFTTLVTAWRISNFSLNHNFKSLH
jgi:hypothetical protein